MERIRLELEDTLKTLTEKADSMACGN